MSQGLATTLALLTSTANRAADDLLVPALDSPHSAVREGSLRAILERRSGEGLKELLSRWHLVSPEWKAIMLERPGRLASAMRDGILGHSQQLCANACDAALRLAEYDLVPALVTAAEAQTPNGNLAAHTLLALAAMLYDELARGRDWQRRDPQLFRAHVVAALELGVQRFGAHGRKEMIEALLMLATRDNAALKRILNDPLDRCHVPVVECLTQSRRPGVVRLLLAFLEDPQAPRAAINVLGHREDDEFLQHLTRRIGFEPSPGARVNLKRLTKIVWLQQDLRRLMSLDDAGQHAVVQIAVCSGLARGEVFQVLRFLLLEGRAGGRRAAVAALAEFQGVDANRLALQALRDEDPHVQAQALAQLRQRGVPGAMATLIEALDSPSELVRQAARSSLREFNAARYLAAFDAMDDHVRRSTGQLVRKVDLGAARVLAEDLQAPARGRRLRALEAAFVMEMVEELQDAVLPLLADEDHMVRAEAARALAQCSTERARLALREALLDRSVAVRNAAEQSLEVLAAGPARRKETIDLGAIAMPEHSLPSPPVHRGAESPIPNP